MMPTFAIERGHTSRWRASTVDDLHALFGTLLGERQRRVCRKFAVGVVREAPPTGGPYEPWEEIPQEHLAPVTLVIFLTSDRWLEEHAPPWLRGLEWVESLDDLTIDGGDRAQAWLDALLGAELGDDDDPLAWEVS